MTLICSVSNRNAAKMYRARILGYAVLCLVICVWAGFALTLRAIGISSLTPADVAFIRFLVPLVILLPFTFRRWGELLRVAPLDALLVLVGGVPFFFIASEGARTTSAAYVGALIAGTSPVSVALISRVIERQSINRRKLLPLGLILLGALGMVLGQPKADASISFFGVGLLLLASLIWGAYTIGLRRTGLDAVSNGLLVSAGSLIVMATMLLLGLTHIDFGRVTLLDAAPFVLVQGIGVGLVSTVGYAFAISRIGARQSAAIGSLAPALAAVLAIPFLGEVPSMTTLAAIVLIIVGVILSNRS